MLELPEALTIASQLNKTVAGKQVQRVLPPTKPHKFCWFNGEPETYDGMIAGSRILKAAGFGIFAELTLDNGVRLCFNDGVNLRLSPPCKPGKDFQLCIELEDGLSLLFTVAMYGGIIAHAGDYDNAYYLSSRNALSPFSEKFGDYYWRTLESCKPSLSVKAFLATEQRFPGIGNGVLQDILFRSGLHPKRKLSTLSQAERDKLLECSVSTLWEMTDKGGCDTEKDLFGVPGRYVTQMSKNALEAPCPICGGTLVKEAYLGGSVYYCPNCQPMS